MRGGDYPPHYGRILEGIRPSRTSLREAPASPQEALRTPAEDLGRAQARQELSSGGYPHQHGGILEVSPELAKSP